MTWSRTAYACLLALQLFACKKEEEVGEQDASAHIAQAYCEQVFDCICADSAGFTSVEACFATVLDQLRMQQADAIENSLVYDPQCVAEAIDRIDRIGCSRNPDEVPECVDCFAYHGLLPDKSQCTRVGPFSTCDQGLACVTRMGYDGEPIDVCTPACLQLGAGQLCAFEGPGYQELFECEEGLWCDTSQTGVCYELPGPGFPCLDEITCGLDAWCDTSVATPICASLKQVSEGCATDLECASTWCRDGARCVEPFAEGAPCIFTEDRCDVGLFCPMDYPFCIPTDALLCQGPLAGF